MPTTAYTRGSDAAKLDVRATKQPRKSFPKDDPDFQKGYQETYPDYKKGFKAAKDTILKFSDKKKNTNQSELYQQGYDAAFIQFDEKYNQGKESTREERAKLLGMKSGLSDKEGAPKKPQSCTKECWQKYQEGFAEGRELKKQKPSAYSLSYQDNALDELNDAYQQASRDVRLGLKMALGEISKHSPDWQREYETVYKEYSEGLLQGRQQLHLGRSREVDPEKFSNKSPIYCKGFEDAFVEFDIENNDGMESTLRRRGYLLGRKEAKTLRSQRAFSGTRSIPPEFKEEYERGFSEAREQMENAGSGTEKKGLALLKDIEERDLLEKKPLYDASRNGTNHAISGKALIKTRKCKQEDEDYWICFQYGYIRYAVENGFTESGNLKRRAFTEGTEKGRRSEAAPSLEDLASLHPDVPETEMETFATNYNEGFAVGNHATTKEGRKFSKARKRGRSKAQAEGELGNLANRDLLEQEGEIIGYNETTAKPKKSQTDYRTGYGAASKGFEPYHSKPTDWSEEKWLSYQKGFNAFQQRHKIQNNAQIYFLRGYYQAIDDIKRDLIKETNTLNWPANKWAGYRAYLSHRNDSPKPSVKTLMKENLVQDEDYTANDLVFRFETETTPAMEIEQNTVEVTPSNEAENEQVEKPVEQMDENDDEALEVLPPKKRQKLMALDKQERKYYTSNRNQAFTLFQPKKVTPKIATFTVTKATEEYDQLLKKPERKVYSEIPHQVVTLNRPFELPKEINENNVYIGHVDDLNSDEKGVFARNDIPAGEFFLECIGEIQVEPEKIADDIDEYKQAIPFIIKNKKVLLITDKKSNSAGFINHAINANAEIVWSEVYGKPLLKATRTIHRHEQVLICYDMNLKPTYVGLNPSSTAKKSQQIYSDHIASYSADPIELPTTLVDILQLNKSGKYFVPALILALIQSNQTAFVECLNPTTIHLPILCVMNGESEYDFIENRQQNHTNALMVACCIGNSNAVELLLKNGAEVNAQQTLTLNTALFHLLTGEADAATRLIIFNQLRAHGVHLFVTNQDNKNIYELCLTDRRNDLVKNELYQLQDFERFMLANDQEESMDQDFGFTAAPLDEEDSLQTRNPRLLKVAMRVGDEGFFANYFSSHEETLDELENNRRYFPIFKSIALDPGNNDFKCKIFSALIQKAGALILYDVNALTLFAKHITDKQLFRLVYNSIEKSAMINLFMQPNAEGMTTILTAIEHGNILLLKNFLERLMKKASKDNFSEIIKQIFQLGTDNLSTILSRVPTETAVAALDALLRSYVINFSENLKTTVATTLDHLSEREQSILLASKIKGLKMLYQQIVPEEREVTNMLNI